MPSVELKRSDGEIYVYLELYKQKRRADDELEFSRVPYRDPKQKRTSARDGNWGGGGGNLPVVKMIMKKLRKQFPAKNPYNNVYDRFTKNTSCF